MRFIRCITHHWEKYFHILNCISKGSYANNVPLFCFVNDEMMWKILNRCTFFTVFQDGLCHDQICSQGHKFTDREKSRAARLLRLHCYCTSHDLTPRLSKHQWNTSGLCLLKAVIWHTGSLPCFRNSDRFLVTRFTQHRQELRWHLKRVNPVFI